MELDSTDPRKERLDYLKRLNRHRIAWDRLCAKQESPIVDLLPNRIEFADVLKLRHQWKIDFSKATAEGRVHEMSPSFEYSELRVQFDSACEIMVFTGIQQVLFCREELGGIRIHSNTTSRLLQNLLEIDPDCLMIINEPHHSAILVDREVDGPKEMLQIFFWPSRQ